MGPRVVIAGSSSRRTVFLLPLIKRLSALLSPTRLQWPIGTLTLSPAASPEAASADRGSAPMDPASSLRHQRSPGSDRFLGLFSSSPNSASGDIATDSGDDDELQEDDIFSAGDLSEPDGLHPVLSVPSPAKPAIMPGVKATGSCPSPLSGAVRRNFVERTSFGILAALPEEDKSRKPLLHRKANVAAASTISMSTSPSSSSARVAIPAVPKTKADFSMSVPAGKIYQQSLPVNVPVGPPKAMSAWGALDVDAVDADKDDEGMMPPHEIVARGNGSSPMTTFSVLEGVGRTLKGRDLRQVRNAVWRKTGFLD